jgi:hypothetical protein
MGGVLSSGRADTKEILNTILRGMFSRADLIDLYSISDPSKCSKYIVATSGALEKMFAKVNLYPSKGDDGVLFFQKLEGIEKTNPNKAAQDSYCKELSFFFIRIFQIYGAIVLTHLDQDIPASYPDSGFRERGDIGRRVVFYNREKGVAGLPADKRRSFRLWGGSLTGNPTFSLSATAGTGPTSGTYVTLLNRHLTLGENNNAPLIIDGQPGIQIPQESLYNNPNSDATQRITKTPLESVSLLYSSQRDDVAVGSIEATLYLREAGDKLTVELRDVKMDGKLPLDKLVTTTMRRFGTSFLEERTNNDFPKTLRNLLDKGFNLIDPPPFNAGDFLFRKRIIPYKDVVSQQMEGTDIYVKNPNISGYDVDIEFQTRKQFQLNTEKKERSIKIKTSITLKKGDITTSGQAYTLCVNFDDLRVVPEELSRYVDIRGYYHPAMNTNDCKGPNTIFYTGPNDEGIPKNAKKETIQSYLQRIFNKMLKDTEGDIYSRNGIKYTADGVPKPHNSETINESLRIKWLWDALRKDPPVKAHCIGRAMQLLNPTALKNGDFKDAYTSVCKTKFAWTQNGSLPKPGQGITSSLGIKALSVLFVKLIDGNMKIDPNDGKFNQFKKNFKEYFERIDTRIPGQDTVPSNMDDIKDLLLPGCQGKDGPIDINASDASTLSGYTNSLISRQEQHLRASMEIIYMLFDERAVREGKYALSSYVIERGMEAVNEIAERARIMLSEYYGDCEKYYRDALYYLHNSWKKRATGNNLTRRVRVAPAIRGATNPV